MLLFLSELLNRVVERAFLDEPSLFHVQLAQQPKDEAQTFFAFVIAGNDEVDVVDLIIRVAQGNNRDAGLKGVLDGVSVRPRVRDENDFDFTEYFEVGVREEAGGVAACKVVAAGEFAEPLDWLPAVFSSANDHDVFGCVVGEEVCCEADALVNFGDVED